VPDETALPSVNAMKPEATWREEGPSDAKVTWIFAHGAGVGMDSPFMDFFAQGIAAGGIRVVRFEFPYMQQRRRTGIRRPPAPAAVLQATWREMIAELRRRRGGSPALAIGGKSMGGRQASLIADEAAVDALVCLGFPFQSPGKSQPQRLEALRRLKTPTLILQGTRDPFGGPAEVAEYRLGTATQLHWLEDGNHDFVPRRRAGRTTEQNWQEGVETILRFLNAVKPAR
jgi:predicted alpha/beta-hydrolase family hydrolase